MEFSTEASLALWLHAGQVTTTSKANSRPVQCNFDDRIIVERRALHAPRAVLERQPMKPGDSGWFLGQFGAESPVGAEGLLSLMTYQIERLHPSVIRLRALPVGTIAVIRDNVIERVIGSDMQTLIRGPYSQRGCGRVTAEAAVSLLRG